MKTWSKMCKMVENCSSNGFFHPTPWTLSMTVLGASTCVCGQCLVCWEEDGEKQEWRPGPHHHHPLVSTADWATTTLQRGNCFPHLQQDATIASSAAPPTLGCRSYFDGGILFRMSETEWTLIGNCFIKRSVVLNWISYYYNPDWRYYVL